MKKESNCSKNIIIGLMTAAFAAVMGLLYAYYYDLNDDVLMKDILAGVFTGEPASHNIQMLYPISLILSGVYRMFSNADCYGIYLILCQYVSLFILIRFCVINIFSLPEGKPGRKLSPAKKTIIRLFVAAALFVISFALIAGHFVFVQYTFTVAMLCAAAAVLFADRRGVLGTVLVILAFLTRSEMTSLMLPFVLLIPFYRFLEEDKKGRKKEIAAVLIIVLGLVASELLNFAGYSLGEWRAFNSFFDSRTQIYDFYQIPDYDDNKEFYESIDLKESEYELLVNYNFGIDEKIDAGKMAEIAAYAKSIREKEGLFEAVKRCLPLYLYRLRSVGIPKSFEYPMTDAPWNIITLLMYLVVLGLAFLKGKQSKKAASEMGKAFFRLIVLFAGRTLLWMYILVRGRDPIRITHSLYLLEIVVLVILTSWILRDIENFDGTGSDRDCTFNYHFLTGGCLLIFLVIGAVFTLFQDKIIRAEIAGREATNKAYEELDEFFKNNADRFFFEDVYTSVAYEDSGYTYSQRIGIKADNEISNAILMGGWASKSPLEKEKLAFYGLDDSMEIALFDEKAYIAADKDRDMGWIVRYYEDKGKSVELTKEEEVGGEFVIWKLSEERR
ncbi:MULTISPECIES: hypothetical protein [unclassified Butyrivibrio]|uniref:hypothetical protein n=1 Tax=unclassified Butyrivibrio TaxID=2639466 RepID=UPI00041C401B|nr:MULTISPECIES: hypothetical protein [unclassified Butyrivibrio]